MRVVADHLEYQDMLKRVKRVFPLFGFSKCDCCGDYFRYEFVWKLRVEYECGWGECCWNTVEACRTCLPTKNDAVDYLKQKISFEKL